MNSNRVLPSLTLSAIVLLIIVGCATCRHRSHVESIETEKESGAEPDQYSATVVRTVIDGTSRQSMTTKEARSGELRREEWTEEGQNRALILRPDIGKVYLMDLDSQVYAEIELNDSNKNLDSQIQNREDKDSTTDLVQAVDRVTDDTQSPDAVETRAVGFEDVDGHPCQVHERRTTFVDGHVEITKNFRAPDLGGLILRSESSSEPPSVTTITERRDVSADVAPGTFAVPSNFKRVDKLSR